MARLILATAEGQQAIDLRPINSLGRHPNNTIQLLDKIVSKEHCILELRESHFVLRDLGSLNGTYVNGERVRGEILLKHGDDIALGSTRARYDDGSGSPLPLPPVGPGAGQHSMGPSPWPGTPPPRSGSAASAVLMPQPPPRPPSPSYSAQAAPPVSATPFVAPAAVPRPASVAGTRVDVLDAARAIGTQIAAQAKGFLAFD